MSVNWSSRDETVRREACAVSSDSVRGTVGCDRPADREGDATLVCRDEEPRAETVSVSLAVIGRAGDGFSESVDDLCRCSPAGCGARLLSGVRARECVDEESMDRLGDGTSACSSDGCRVMIGLDSFAVFLRRLSIQPSSLDTGTVPFNDAGAAVLAALASLSMLAC